MQSINISYINEMYIKIDSELSILKEMHDYFTYSVPNYLMIRRQNRRLYNWDGKIRLMNLKSQTLPYGLLDHLKDFCKERTYQYNLDDKISNNKNNVTKEELTEYIKSLNLKLELRDYQFNILFEAINRKKISVISPTSSGKTLPISIYVDWCLKHTDKKIIIIVPTLGLIQQMYGDFNDYGFNIPIHKIFSGQNKDSSERVYLTTWQSLQSIVKSGNLSYFEQFKSIVVDEAHNYAKTSKESKFLSKLINYFTNAEYKLCVTGTIHDEVLNQIQVESLFGKIFKAAQTKDLINRGILSKFKINVLHINYPKDVSSQLNKLEWDKQQEFMEANENPRQNLIVELTKSLPTNSLVLFRKITHGKFLYEQFLKETQHRTILYVDGSVSGEEREVIRKQMEKETNAILVASYGTFSTGINIKNLHNIIFASSGKSKIRILQSIGRGLRLHDSKDHATLYDIVDGISFMKDHYLKRLEFYIREKFPYKEKSVDIMAWAKERNIDFFTSNNPNTPS